MNAYSMGLLQGKAYARLSAFLNRALVPFDLSIPEWKLLGQLYEHGEMRLAELAEYLNYDPPMVTKLAKQLEKKGFVKRSPDDKDERAKVINITTPGSNLVEKIEPEVKKVMATILNGVTRKELLIYIKILTVIVTNTEKY